MTINDKPIFIESPQAAQIKTVTGWFSRIGTYWGNDEKMARFEGHTHIHCPCGKDHERGYCSIEHKQRLEKDFASYPKLPFDKGSGVFNLLGTDTFFYEFSGILEYISEEGIVDINNLKLVHCEGQGLSTLDSDHWADELPEDGELPDCVYEAMQALNLAIKQAGDVSYYPASKAVAFTDEQQKEISQLISDKSVYE